MENVEKVLKILKERADFGEETILSRSIAAVHAEICPATTYANGCSYHRTCYAYIINTKLYSRAQKRYRSSVEEGKLIGKKSLILIPQAIMNLK